MREKELIAFASVHRSKALPLLSVPECSSETQGAVLKEDPEGLPKHAHVVRYFASYLYTQQSSKLGLLLKVTRILVADPCFHTAWHPQQPEPNLKLSKTQGPQTRLLQKTVELALLEQDLLVLPWPMTCKREATQGYVELQQMCLLQCHNAC